MPWPFPARWCAPLVLTLIGAGLRFYGLADFVVNIDHAYPIAQAIGLLQSGRWPLLGQGTSLLFSNPAGMSYMVLLPWAAFGTGWGVHFCVAALNALVVPLTYRLVRQMIGPRLPGAANAAAALAAFSPWLIHYSRGAWVQGLLPLWSVMAFTLLAEALWAARLSSRQRGARLLAGLLALTALTQMYLLAFLMVAPAALILWLGRRGLAGVPVRRALAAGAVVFGLATGLYGIQLARDWPAQSARLQRFSAPSEPLVVQRAALEHAARLVTGRDYEVTWGNDASAAWQQRRVAGLALSTLLAAALIVGVARAAWRLVRREPDAGFWAAALLWWGVPVLAMTVTRHPVHIVYLVLTVPAGYVLAAPVLAFLARRWWGAGLALLLGVHTLSLLSAVATLTAAQPIGASLDELSLRAAEPFGRTVRQLAAQYTLDEFYAPLEPASLSARSGLDLASASWAVLPQVPQFPVGRPAAYIQFGRGQAPPRLRLAERVALLEYPEGDFVAFDLVPAYTRQQVSALPEHPLEWPSQQGLTLVGYDLPPSGEVLRLYYAVDTLEPARTEWLFGPYAHVIDAQGQVVGNVDAPGLPGYYYRQGDVFVADLHLPDLPAGAYRLEMGLFDGLHGQGVTFVPPSGPQPFFTTEIQLP